MTDPIISLPVVAAIPLPDTVLRAPLRRQQAAEPPSPDAAAADPAALCEVLEPLISAAIARKARQRRYTP